MIWWVGLALAHDLSPAVVALHERQHGVFDVRVTPGIGSDGLPLVPRPEWPQGCRQRGAELRCPTLGAVGFVGERQGRVLVTVRWRDGRADQALVAEDQHRVQLGPGRFVDWLGIGMEHVLGGLDHLLFVCGLFLVCLDPKRLLGAVTAFTVAHSVTLSAAVFGVVVAPMAAIELLIALSVLLVAREALSERHTLTRRMPWLVALGFGLVHGFGFAGALAEIGLPEQARLWSLLWFNVGVELGQLAVLAVVTGLAVMAARLPEESQQRLKWLAAYAVGIPAGIWTVERTWIWLTG